MKHIECYKCKQSLPEHRFNKMWEIAGAICWGCKIKYESARKRNGRSALMRGFNSYREVDDYAVVEAKGGGNGTFLVSLEDIPRLVEENRRWLIRPSGYVVTSGKTNYVGWSAYLHRVIMNAPNGVEVDHVNGNRSDCRRENLKLVSRKENMLAMQVRTTAHLSGEPGAIQCPECGKWSLEFDKHRDHMRRVHDNYMTKEERTARRKEIQIAKNNAAKHIKRVVVWADEELTK